MRAKVAAVFLSVVAVGLLGWAGQPVVTQLGDLPPNPLVVEEVRDVRVELSLRFWVNPELVADRIPEGTNLRTVASFEIEDSVIPARFHHWADASLVFLSADHLAIDQEPAVRKDAGAFKAFWWLNTEAPPVYGDSRTRGDHQAVELNVWFADPAPVARLNRAGLQAAAADIDVGRTENGWRFRLATSDVRIEGSCLSFGPVTREDYPLPAYSTVWHAGRPSPAFTVFTFQGHEWRRCRLDDLEVTGTGALASSLRASVAIQPPSVVLMDSWEARSGTYGRNGR